MMGITSSSRCFPPLTDEIPHFQVEEIKWMLKGQRLVQDIKQVLLKISGSWQLDHIPI